MRSVPAGTPVRSANWAVVSSPFTASMGGNDTRCYAFSNTSGKVRAVNEIHNRGGV
jgi:hypothetical protein